MLQEQTYSPEKKPPSPLAEAEGAWLSYRQDNSPFSILSTIFASPRSNSLAVVRLSTHSVEYGHGDQPLAVLDGLPVCLFVAP
jgi:hypothetical protein